jgi:hypothetical protein
LKISRALVGGILSDLTANRLHDNMITISPCGRRLAIEFCLVLCVLLFMTMPGSLVLSGFDQPYGIVAGITTWMSAFVGLSPVALLYLLLRWDSLGRKAIPVTVAFAVSVFFLAFATHSLAQPAYGEYAAGGYVQSFPAFCIASVLSASLALMLFPVGILPGNYLHGPEYMILGIVNLGILAVILVLWWIRPNGE